MNCKNCAKEMTCNKEKCNFKSWIQTKNYGVPSRIQSEARGKNNS